MVKRKIILFLIVMSVSVELFAQGIVFKETIDTRSAFKEARVKNKLIFIDFYTVWCGPCKKMARDVFTQEKVGEFFNENFLCYKLDAEKAGKELADKYEVGSFPTLLFLKADGSVVDKFGVTPGDELLKKAQKVLEQRNSSETLGSLHTQYPSKREDEAFLMKYIKRLKESKGLSFQVIDDYLRVQTSMQPAGKEMMEFLMGYGNYLLLGGCGNRIFNENMDAYLALVPTDMRKQLVMKFPNRIAMNTRERALAMKDAALYRAFLEYMQKGEVKANELEEYRMELLSLEGKKEEYMKQMTAYIDGMTRDERVKKAMKEEADAPGTEALLKHHVGDMLKSAFALLGTSEKVIEKDFSRWIKYMEKLTPDYFVVSNFKANVLYKARKRDEAVRVKQEALRNVPEYHKANYWIADELKQMEAGKFKGGRNIVN